MPRSVRKTQATARVRWDLRDRPAARALAERAAAELAGADDRARADEIRTWLADHPA